MPAPSGFISQQQYNLYTSDWAALIHSGDNDALRQAFQAPGVARINFLTFSIDQILALVTATNAELIKVRFLLMPDAAGSPRFSATLFAIDSDDKRVSEYYIPTPAAATTTQTVEPAAGPDTKILQATALSWLTDWVTTAASSFTTAMFTTPSSPLHGYNFEVSAFQDPLAAAPPYPGKSLFLNLGLTSSTDPAPTPALVVYINMLASRTQGTLAGIPTDDSFYDSGKPCPPSP